MQNTNKSAKNTERTTQNDLENTVNLRIVPLLILRSRHFRIYHSVEHHANDEKRQRRYEADEKYYIRYEQQHLPPVVEDSYGRSRSAGYPADMPDEEGLAALWRDKNAAFSQEGKRLIVFAPQGTAYEKLAEKLDNSRIFYTVKSGNLNDIDLVDFACRSKNLL